jgi:hypothetical protein
MSNDLPNCGVVDQFHNDLLVEGLTDSDNIPTLPGTWPLIEHKWRLNSRSRNVESGRSQFLVLMSKYRRLSTYRHEIFVTRARVEKFCRF